MPQDDLTSAAFGVYPRQRATPSSPETREALARTVPEAVAEYALPHDAVDLGMMLIGGPLGRMGRQLGAALIAGGTAGDAEASPLKKAAEWVGKTFYRGIPRLEGKNIESISGLHMPERGAPVGASPHLRANTGNFAWANDNPFIGESYTHMGGVMVPLELAENPGAILDAKGAHWRDFFYTPSSLNSPKLQLRKPYRDAFEDPEVRSVLVKNIIDPGLAADSNSMRNRIAISLYGKPFDDLSYYLKDLIDLKYKGLEGNSLLIKDPAAVKYKLTGEPANFERGGHVTSAAFGFNPNLRRSGAKSLKLAEARDVNTLADPRTYAAVAGLLGIAPDELGFSALHPDREGIRRAADPAFAVGTALGVSPVAGALGELASMTRTGRNLGRAVRGADPIQAALDEIRRAAPSAGMNEMAVAVSPRGIVGPVRVGTEGSVSPANKSALSYFTDKSKMNGVHTHSKGAEGYYSLHPGDVNLSDGLGSTSILHTDELNRPTGDFERLMRPEASNTSGWSQELPSDYRAHLKASGRYESTLPEEAYSNERYGDLYSSPDKFEASPGSALRELERLYSEYQRHGNTDIFSKSVSDLAANESKPLVEGLTAPLPKNLQGRPLDLAHFTYDEPSKLKPLGSGDRGWAYSYFRDPDLPGFYGIRPESLKHPEVLDDLENFGPNRFDYSVDPEAYRQLRWPELIKGLKSNSGKYAEDSDQRFHLEHLAQSVIADELQKAGLGGLRRPTHPENSFTGNLDEFITFDPKLIKPRANDYARGGHVARQAGGEVFPNAAGPDTSLPPNVVAPGRKRGGLTQIKECACHGR